MLKARNCGLDTVFEISERIATLKFGSFDFRMDDHLKEYGFFYFIIGV
jgi:hypothetical protein